MAIRIYHPDHGIIFVTDEIEIKRLLETGGSTFGKGEKPWLKKEETKPIEQEAPQHAGRGRPKKWQ